MIHRPRRLRSSQSLRDMVAETHLTPSDFIAPYFLIEGENLKEPLGQLPGQYRWSLDQLLKEVEEIASLGIKGLLLFASISENLKDSQASEALNPKGLLPKAIKTLKNEFPHLTLFSDVALDPFSSDGHDGLVQNGKVLNDETLSVLSHMAIVHGDAGVDFVAPSDMMDGRVLALREALDESGHKGVGILSYTAKYASNFYGPFREALDSAPRSGDKKTYQMDFRNRAEALKELSLDLREGADMVMVKPALCYLDVIRDIKLNSSVPVVAYNVSGEYAMIKFAAERGVMDERLARDESLIAIKRSGADLIASYFAKEFCLDFKR